MQRNRPGMEGAVHTAVADMVAGHKAAVGHMAAAVEGTEVRLAADRVVGQTAVGHRIAADLGTLGRLLAARSRTWKTR